MTDRDQNAVLQVSTEDTIAKTPDPERKLGMSMLMKVALAAVLLSSFVISISCLMKANQLQNESRELQDEITEYNEKIKQLKYFINKEVDDEYIIQYAREYLNMHFPDEEIYYGDVND